MPSDAFSLIKTYVHIEDGPGVALVPVGDDFWEKIGERTDLHEGRMVMAFHFNEDWPVWERHPAGDEIVIVLSGAIDLVLEENGEERLVGLKSGKACILPRNVWHTARVREPGNALHITRGAGTEHRPVSS